ncbi:DUF262 domain-containing protein [Microseira wollei]|nr:DUF262 domain-containing protein [Microseira wollei]
MSFGELLGGNNSYSVPLFQRDYSWTDEQVEQLWQDITETLDEKRSEHFIGAIVVNSSEKPKLMLIDGQQRVATISILMCVLRDIAKENGDSQLADTISQKYLGSLNLRTRKIESKLVLSEKNNQFFQDNIIESKNLAFLRQLSRGLSKKKDADNKSNKLIVDAYLLLHKWVQERSEKVGQFEEVILELEECVKNQLISILISVADEANSYLIFETLNDRGLDLSVADLLKNYLFSRASEKLKEVQRKWDDINRLANKFELKTFIRHYWMSKYEVVPEKELYRKISEKFKSSSEVFGFVKELSEAAELYNALEDSRSPVWNDYSQEVRADIERLDLFQVSQCYSVLMAAKENLADELFPKILRIMVIVSFRYNVICELNPNKPLTIYSEVAKYIRSEKPRSAKSIFEATRLPEIYPSDIDFERAFAEKTIPTRNAKLARYILSEIESYYRGSNKELVANPNATQVNLEHILPQTPKDEWLVEFPKKEYDQYVDKLGNMTLLSSPINRKVGNASFKQKCTAAFAQSELKITQEVLEYPVWGPKQIEERQRKMAKAACRIWRLDY